MIYIRINENTGKNYLVLLLNDTLVKLFFSMKSSVGKCTCVHFGKLPEKWVNTSRMQMKYLSCCLDDIYCFCASIYGKLFPWEFTDGQRRENSMFGSLCIFNLKKVFNSTI